MLLIWCTEFYRNIFYLCAAFEEQPLQPRTAADERLDAVFSHLITPGDVQLLQHGTALTTAQERRREE